MRQARCFAAHSALSLALLVALIGAEDADDEDALFSEFEDDSDDSDGISVAKSGAAATTTTTTSSRPRREELPEDGFVWATTDEEHYADQLPNEHRCNGCKGVAFQVDKALKELMPKGGKRVLAEHEFTEAMECRTKIYDDYGLKKLVDKSRVLVGPGLANSDDQGSVFGGAKWPTRMARYCGMLVGDIGEEEVYRLWVSHGSEGFSDALCSAICEGGRRKKTKKEELEETDAEPVKKKRRKSVAKTKEKPNIDGSPEVIKIYEKKEMKKILKKKKFIFLLFCAPSFHRCKDLEFQFELGARAAKKTADLKDVAFAMANTDEVGTFDYQVQNDILPAFLLFRKGYTAPKGITPDEMMRLREAGDFLNYMQSELEHYLQDDPDSFPRGKFEL